MKNTAFILLCTLALSACDKVDTPYPPNNGSSPVDTTTTDTTTNWRVILLEDYTGVGCQACPSAALTGRQLDSIYGERLVIMSVHAGYFTTGGGNPWYPTIDLSTPDGDLYNTTWGVDAVGNPQGMVNRSDITNGTGDIILTPSEWSQAVSTFYTDYPIADFKITETHTYSGGNLDVHVDVSLVNDVSSDYNVVVALTEDSIITFQKTLPAGTMDSNYVQKHVFRGCITNAWGEPLVTGGGATGASYRKDFTGFAVDPSWDDTHIAVVTYIRDATSEEVMQVCEHPLIQ